MDNLGPRDNEHHFRPDNSFDKAYGNDEHMLINNGITVKVDSVFENQSAGETIYLTATDPNEAVEWQG